MGTVNMLGGLFSRQNRNASVPPPPKVIEPTLIPSQQKRQEKERRWIESISSRNLSGKAGQSGASHPPLPAPVEFIKKDQPASGLLSARPEHSASGSKNGLLDRWNASHKRGNTAGISNSPSATLGAENRSLRTTRSASTLASKIGLGRRSKERERQKSSSSSLLTESTAIPPQSSPYTTSPIPQTPPLLQLGGESVATFVHVPQFSPSSALLLAPSESSASSSAYFSSSVHTPVSCLSPVSSRHTTDSRTASTPTTSQYSHVSHTGAKIQSRSSKTENTKTLAARLQELEHANSVGLLDDEAYRVLRQHLFEKNVNSPPSTVVWSLNQAPLMHPNSDMQVHEDSSQSSPKIVPQVTGSLLGLPRLNMAQGDTREAHIPDPAPTAHLAIPDPSLLQESSTSVHSKTSRFSLRSARSHLTTRSSISQMSRIFRKSGSSAPASTAATQDWANRQPHLYEHIPPLPTAANVLPDHRNHDGETTSSKSKPVGLSRRLTKKGSIPGDWKQLQQLHLLETEREAWKLNNEREAILLAGLDMEQGQATARSESRYRTTRKYSVTLQESDFVACTQNVSGNSPSIHDTRSDKGRGAIPDPAVPPSHHHNSNLTERTSMYTLSENAVSTLRYTSMFTIQPGDEELDSAGLRQAIATLREEKKRLLVQFDDLEGALHEKYGDPALAATRAHTQRRRDSVSAVSTTGRRMSLSSSVVSSQGGYSVLSTAKGSGSLVPTSPMSRRPSKASSIASSSMRRGLNSSGSTHPGSMETYPTSRPPSTVEEELLFTAISGEGGDDTTRTPHASDLQFQKEYYDLQERKRNIQEKYSARLEYLEARLQGQLNKEKLRR